MRMRFLVTLTFLAALLSGGCGLFDSTDSAAFSVAVYQPDVSGALSLTLAGNAEGAAYSVIALSSATVSASNVYSITASSGTGSGAGSLVSAASPVPLSRRFSDRAMAQQRRFDQRVRELVEGGAFNDMEDFSRASARALKADESCTSDAGCSGFAFCDNGACRSELTLNYTDPDTMEVSAVKALVKRVGQHGIIVVDEDDEVAAADIESLGKMFDNIIHPRDMTFFGQHLNPDYMDRDLNDRVIIFMTGRLNTSDGFAGLFNAADFASTTQVPESNQRDLFYVVVPDEQNPLSLIYATLAHEYQHMINFAARYVQRALDSDSATNPVQSALWVNEGLSHLAEDVVGFGDDVAAAAYLYLQHPERFSLAFADLDGQVDTVQARGMAYLLLRYLFERKGAVVYDPEGPVIDNGGAAFLNSFFSTEDVGLANLKQASGGAASLDEHFKNWLVALVVDGTGLSDAGKYNYDEVTQDRITRQYHGMDLRGSRTTSSGAVTLSGPAHTAVNAGAGYEDGLCLSYGAQFLGFSLTADEDLVISADPLAQMSFIVVRTK